MTAVQRKEGPMDIDGVEPLMTMTEIRNLDFAQKQVEYGCLQG